MLCQTENADLMSLRLDGLLDNDDERRLDEHVASCDGCRLLWAAMKQADDILSASALEPLPAPATLHVTVMTRIAAPARAALQEAPPVFLPVPVGTPLEPAGPATRTLAPLPTGALPAYVFELQSRLASYARSAVAITLAVAGTISLALAVVLSGVIPLSGPVAEFVDVTSTFFEAAGAWFGSAVAGAGPALWGVTGLLAGLLVLVAWQVVVTYQRAAAEARGATGFLGERGNTGLLVEAARP
jgi:anti-sigma factor RsiW